MNYLLFGGGLYMVLMALVWLTHRAKNMINYYFAAMYSSTGLIVLYAWAERTGLIYRAFPLYDIQIPLCYAFAPLLYYGFSQITDLHRRPASVQIAQFIPAIVSLPIVVANDLLHASLFASLPEKAAPSVVQGHPTFFAVHLLGLGSDAYILYFLFRILISGATLMRGEELKTFRELGYLLAYVALFVLDVALMIVAHLLHESELLYLAKLLSSFTFILFSFFTFRFPEYTQQVIRRSRHIRYENTQLRGLNTEELLDRLDYLMRTKKVYKRADLTIVFLSSQLGVTPHQLSEIFNDRLKINFRTYLNDQRIREAERLLLSRPDASILDIALDAGFNSKASFNATFHRKTGLTPSDYRRQRTAVS